MAFREGVAGGNRPAEEGWKTPARSATAVREETSFPIWKKREPLLDGKFASRNRQVQLNYSNSLFCFFYVITVFHRRYT